jgi:centractin
VFLHLCVQIDSFLFISTLQVILGTKVGRAKHMRIMPGGALEADQELGGPSSVFVGRKLDDHRGAFYLEHPMDKGAVTENGWDAMERLWEVRTT